MRITNQIVSGNSLRNMQKSMQEVNKRTQQLTTGKKISRASEDPVIAIRALKLRTTVTQLEQYKGKNIPDATSWYEITQTSLDTITDKIKGINDYCVQGSTDSFGTSDRSAIIDGLRQLRDMIFAEGNATYAGRYIFSGYKTDRSLVFVTTEDNKKYSYDITQHFTADDLDTKNTVLNEIDYTRLDGYIDGTDTYEQPNPETVY
ncbi:MAG: flagellar hook-associated protein FlgL, partial [Lachnospiraceae bacterium]|nr:flagellar hook-associated protein FlgL [Lachnospiraceae bacterium]